MADALLVSSSFLPGRGGIESYLAELCASLSPRLAAVAAESRDGGRLSHLELPYPSHGAPNRMLLPGRAALAHTLAAAAKEASDKVLFGTPWPLVLLGPRLRERGLRYATVVHGAEMTVPAAIPVVRKRLAAALAGADLLLPVSGYTAERLFDLLERTGHRAPPIELLRARVDLDRFSPQADGAGARARLGISERDKVVLCFGRLVKRKGVDRLLHALPRLAARVPEVVIVVAGTGPESKRLRKLSQSLRGSQGRVVLAGRVPEDEAPGVYRTADVFALPVLDRFFGLEIEGLGVVLLEAAACGVPAVTGRSGGTPEAVLDGRTGFVIDARDEDALVERLTELLLDPAKAAAMGSAARRHVEAEFSERALPEGLMDWLDEPLR